MNQWFTKYLALVVPEQSMDVIQSFGYTIYNVNDADDLADRIDEFIDAEGPPALDALAAIHPDKDLILAATQDKSKGKKMGADGSSTTAFPPAADLVRAMQPASRQERDYTPLLITGLLASAIFLSAAIIVKR